MFCGLQSNKCRKRYSRNCTVGVSELMFQQQVHFFRSTRQCEAIVQLPPCLKSVTRLQSESSTQSHQLDSQGDNAIALQSRQVLSRTRIGFFVLENNVNWSTTVFRAQVAATLARGAFRADWLALGATDRAPGWPQTVCQAGVNGRVDFQS